MSEEDHATNLQGTNTRMIQQTLLDLYAKFKKFLLETRKKFDRKYFPTKEAKKFGSKIKEINEILQSLGDGSERISLLRGFVCSLDTTAKYLHNQDGISAFVFFLDLFINVTTELFNSQQEIVTLMNENRSLIGKVKELESVISDMENELSLEEVSISEDGVFSESLYRKGLLQLVSDSILFSNRTSVTIMETFVAVDDFDGKDKLVVLYEDIQSGNFPLTSDFIVWKDINTLDANLDSGDLDPWTQYCHSQPEQFMQLLKDFYDPNCIDLIETSSDIVAISPTVWRIDMSCPFEPALVVFKKCLGLSHVDNKHSLADNLALTDGRHIKIIVKENYFSKATHQNGIGVLGFDSSYGTIGGIACDMNDRPYVITCEHVVKAAQKLVKKKGKLASKNSHFMIPSQGPRKAYVIAATGAFDPNLKLNGNFLNTLLTEYENSRFQEIFAPVDRAGDVTVKEVAEYIARNQVELSVPRGDILTFCKTTIKEIHTSTHGAIQVRFTGDVAAIPLDSAATTVSFDQISFDIHETFGLQDFFDHWGNGNAVLEVKKKGINDSIKQHGKIVKPIHVQTPTDSKSQFMSDSYNSSTLEFDEDTGLGRVLLGQLLVYGDDGFGRSGDSGSSIYVDDDDMNKLIVGTFVGSFKNRVEYVVSPAEVIAQELQWIKMLL